jgi:hypothetical protein
METFNFSVALSKVKIGKKIARTGWNGKDQYLLTQYPDENSKMTLPYIYMVIAGTIAEDGTGTKAKLVPWLASQTDLLSEDWYEIAEQE